MITGNTKKLATEPTTHETLNPYTYRGRIWVVKVEQEFGNDGRNGTYVIGSKKITTFKLANGAKVAYRGEYFADVGDVIDVTVRVNRGYEGQTVRETNRIWIK